METINTNVPKAIEADKPLHNPQILQKDKGPIYELTVILKPDLGNEAAEQKARSLSSYIITDIKGDIKKEEVLREIVLAYPIKKYTRGFFWTCYFSSKDSSALTKINSNLNIDPLLLRYLVIKHNALPKSESEMLIEKQTAKLMSEIVAIPEIDIEKAGSTAVKEERPIKPTAKKPRKTIKSTLKKSSIDSTQTKAKLEEIDKKIDEILGSEIK